MRRIGIFLALLVVISGPLWWLARDFGFLYTTGLMYAPCFAALATLRLTGGRVAELGGHAPRFRWAFAGWLLPVAAIAVANVASIVLGRTGFPDPHNLAERAAKLGIADQSSPVVVAVLAATGWTFGIVGMCATAFGEEIGWRGFLTPETYRRWGYAGSSLFVGIVWAAWHVPLFAGKMSITGLVLFSLAIIAFAFIQTWLRIASASVWPCVIMHGTHNAVFSQFWDRLVVAPADSDWAGEGSYPLIAVYGLLALVCWSRRRTLAP